MTKNIPFEPIELASELSLFERIFTDEDTSEHDAWEAGINAELDAADHDLDHMLDFGEVL